MTTPRLQTISPLISICLLLSYHLNVSWAWESNLQCPEGWDGPDCSIPYETCADQKRKCYNGSVCVRNNMQDKVTGTYGYHCDCTAISSVVSAYAGEECEHASTQICSFGFVGHSFCTNGGKCLQFIANDEKHVGCDCPEDFSGSHCQFVKGSKKTNGDVLINVKGEHNIYGDKRLNEKNSHVAIIATTVISVLFAASFVGILSYYIDKRRKYQLYQKDIQQYEEDVSYRNQHDAKNFQIDDDQEIL